eukprot:TRINITY_DN4720_c1_g2_i1.p1 TRINITY_DN4720_c1_g2~~TRINITY_DN4720_c1_g2_i1.p1  ORF type:complete len:221 (-),score=62.48 TRINITY_DN4720_c1_g2_i1:789-1397(-)
MAAAAATMVHAESGTIWPSKRSDKRLSTPGWRLHKGHGERSFTQHINFVRPFAAGALPQVFIAFSALDVLQELEEHKIAIRADAVSSAGMDIVISTWGKCQVWSASASFFVFDGEMAQADKARLETGTYAFTKHLAAWSLNRGNGPRKFSVHILFKKPFAAPPAVVACISGVDVTSSEDHRCQQRATPAQRIVKGFCLRGRG